MIGGGLLFKGLESWKSKTADFKSKIMRFEYSHLKSGSYDTASCREKQLPLID
jgi:hypothetical protein